jgi:hypothetical protein
VILVPTIELRASTALLWVALGLTWLFISLVVALMLGKVIGAGREDDLPPC